MYIWLPTFVIHYNSPKIYIPLLSSFEPYWPPFFGTCRVRSLHQVFDVAFASSWYALLLNIFTVNSITSPKSLFKCHQGLPRSLHVKFHNHHPQYAHLLPIRSLSLLLCSFYFFPQQFLYSNISCDLLNVYVYCLFYVSLIHRKHMWAEMFVFLFACQCISGGWYNAR